MWRSAKPSQSRSEEETAKGKMKASQLPDLGLTLAA